MTDSLTPDERICKTCFQTVDPFTQSYSRIAGEYKHEFAIDCINSQSRRIAELESLVREARPVIQKARDTIADLEQRNTIQATTISNLHEHMMAMQQQSETAGNRLGEWLHHTDWCQSENNDKFVGALPCNCGLAVALASLPPSAFREFASVLDGNKITLRFPSDETASEAYEYLSSLSESAVEPKAVNPHSENTLDGEDTGEYTTEYAIDIAQLWRAGKLIGADKDQIIFALLRGLERKSITTEETSFEQGLKEFEDVTGPISSPPPTVGRMNGPIERMSPPDESFFDETRDCQCAAYCMQARGMKSDPPMNCRGLPALNTGESQ